MLNSIASEWTIHQALTESEYSFNLSNLESYICSHIHICSEPHMSCSVVPLVNKVGERVSQHAEMHERSELWWLWKGLTICMGARPNRA